MTRSFRISDAQGYEALTGVVTCWNEKPSRLGSLPPMTHRGSSQQA